MLSNVLSSLRVYSQIFVTTKDRDHITLLFYTKKIGKEQQNNSGYKGKDVFVTFIELY